MRCVKIVLIVIHVLAVKMLMKTIEPIIILLNNVNAKKDISNHIWYQEMKQLKKLNVKDVICYQIVVLIK